MVPYFELTIQRAGVTATLRVPFTLGSKLRRSRLEEFLSGEKWVVCGGGNGGAIATAGATTEAEVLREELLFLRDSLGPLRKRPGAVPEKVAGKLLEVGVKALHDRCQDLFGRPWADFLLARWPGVPPATSAAPSAATPPPPATLSAYCHPPLAPPPKPLLAPSPAPTPPLPLSLPPLALPAASEAETAAEAESLVEMLLGGSGPACDSTNADELESILTGAGFQLDMAAAVELEAASSPATPPALPLPSAPPPAPRAPAPTASTATSPPTLNTFAVGWSCPSPAAVAFLDELDAALADPLMLAPLGCPPPALDDLDVMALDLPDLPASFPAFF